MPDYAKIYALTIVQFIYVDDMASHGEIVRDQEVVFKLLPKAEGSIEYVHVPSR